MDNERENKNVFAYNRFGSLQEEALQELIHEAKNKYWRDVFWESKNEVLKGIRTWFENKRNGYFYITMNAHATARRALDIGAGSGIISDVVSDYFKNVISLEYNPNFVEFMKLRFTQDKRENIKIIRGNEILLPLKNNVFDLIIVNGVLEWIPNYEPERNPKEVQINFLRQCLQKLKVGGQIIIGTENRFYFNYLLGDTPHEEYPFTTVLPRPLANMMSRMKCNKPYLNYIYSAIGYNRVLKKAGFKNIKLYVIVPNYYNPMIILPIENNHIINRVIRSSDSLPQNKIKKIVYILLLRIGIIRYLMHSFYLVGVKT
jgi:SAM-dependent methyltransferase